MVSPWSRKSACQRFRPHLRRRARRAIVGNTYSNGLIGPGGVLTALAYASNVHPGSACQGRRLVSSDTLRTPEH
jgi:hypothetical protein